jgi:hypothetical protein
MARRLCLSVAAREQGRLSMDDIQRMKDAEAAQDTYHQTT